MRYGATILMGEPSHLHCRAPMRIIWTPEARLDLDDIYDFIADDNPTAAGEVYDYIYQTTNTRLEDNPRFGHEGRVEDTREFVLPRYRRRYTVVYKISDQQIQIVAVWHAKRQWPTSFDRPR